jgi:hypothetical protein
MRLRSDVIGALNVFRVAPGALSDADMRLARALADVATVGILQQRVIQARDLLAEQLQGALNTRVLIEQAKGVLAATSGVGVERAFAVMRVQARRSGASLRAVAAGIIDGTMRLSPAVAPSFESAIRCALRTDPRRVAKQQSPVVSHGTALLPLAR